MLKNKKKKILFILNSIFLVIISFLGVIFIIKHTKNDKTYQIKNNTNYEVVLNPNNYFDNGKLASNNYYIESAIGSIDIYFDYELNTQINDTINYSYNISATIKSYAESGTKLIWTKNFSLKNINNLEEKDIKIKEIYKLDYQYYANYIKTFQEYYKIKTENYLDIKLTIQIDNKDSISTTLTIPIDKDIIEITMQEDNTFLKNDQHNIDFKKILFFIIIVIAIIYLVSKVLFNKDNERTILKEYQDIIIKIQNKPNIDINKIIYLTNIKDLINLAINNNVNIFNYQNNYYIIIDTIYYIYIFK